MLAIRKDQVHQMAQSSPGQQMVQPCDDNKSWVEVHLVDTNNAPVANAQYKIQLPDGSIMQGSLDSEGKVRFDSILPGTCKVTFPEIHAKEWQPL